VVRVKGCGLRPSFKARNQFDEGFAVAEFAVTIPALLFVAAIMTSTIGLAITQLKLETSAGAGARIVGRGDPLPDSFKAGLPSNTKIEVLPSGDLVQLHLISQREVGFQPFSHAVELHASAFARLEPVFDEFG
jgi:hypothetical protein